MPKNVKNNQISIISGKYKGTKLVMPGDSGTHPMGNREKLALFNILGPYLENATVFDVCAGTGALGFEALSRGAEYVVFVDKSLKCTSAIEKTIKNLGLEDQAHTVTKKLYPIDLSTMPTPDIVIIDPPYDDFHPEDFSFLQNAFFGHGILALSHPDSIDPIVVFPDLKLKSTHKYAACNISIFEV